MFVLPVERKENKNRVEKKNLIVHIVNTFLFIKTRRYYERMIMILDRDEKTN